MSEKSTNISDAELALMKVLWDAGEALSAQQVSESLQDKDWKYSTVATLFSRLVDKNAVSFEKRGRFYYYTPLISEKEYKAEQTRTLVRKLYNGSVKNLVVSLFENKQMTKADMEEIKQKFDL